jgi:hypothetical protein
VDASALTDESAFVVMALLEGDPRPSTWQVSGHRARLGLVRAYTLQERGERMHRIAIYRAEHLRIQNPLFFVGFRSARQKQLRQSIIQAIQHTDKKLVEELVDAPGVLSYSSFQLRNGDWCNLVLLNDEGTKMQLKRSETHIYAAYHLACVYYDWIRLHHGVMPEGLDHMEMELLKTKYSGQETPAIRECIYEPPYRPFRYRAFKGETFDA